MSGPVRYDARLVEEVVLRVVDRLTAEERGHFRVRRDAIYELGDVEEREAAFEGLHGEWFLRMGLDRPLHRALAERPSVPARVSESRVLPARRRREEMADLVPSAEAAGMPLLVVRLQPERFLDLGALLVILRRELLHVADMLDADFGYERDLPVCEEGPAFGEILRRRYKAVWATTVAGRLARCEDEASPKERARCREELARAFPTLGAGIGATFDRWFDEPRPTHAAIVAFIQSPDS